MPEIKQFTRTELPRQMMQTSLSPRQLVNTSGQDEVRKLNIETMSEIEQIELRKDKSEYVKKLSEFQIENAKRRQELSSSDFEAGASIPDIYVADLDERAAKLEIPERLKEEFQQDLANMKVNFNGYGIQDQARREGIKTKLNFENTLDNAKNLIALDPSNNAIAKDLIEKQLASLPPMTSEERAQLRDQAFDELNIVEASSIVSNNPDLFLQEVKEGKWNNLKKLPDFLSTAKDIQEKNAKKRSNLTVFEVAKNEADTQEYLMSNDVTTTEKLAKINLDELKGNITEDFAADARRYLKSSEEVDAVTNSGEMANIVTQLYDLNSMADINQKDYLIGINNIRKSILQKRADGLLSLDDEVKINNQIKTLTSAKTSDATKAIAYSFGKSNDLIKEQLPPEYRGEATRQLFYNTVDKDLTENDYLNKSRQIIDSINNKRRASTLEKIKPAIAVDNAIQSDNEVFILSKGYTMNDIAETAKKYNMTTQQVIDKLRNK